MINFSQSYVRWKTNTNSYGRFNLESVFMVYNKEGKAIDSLYSLYGVMACDVYGEAPLFYRPSFFYQAIFSDNMVKVIRNFTPYQQKDSVENISKSFSELDKFITYADESEVKEVSTKDNLKQCILENKTLNAEITFEEGEYTYELQFPVKHINYSSSKEMFQVETGPVAMIDLELKNEDLISNSSLAYVAFNNYNEADFLFYSLETLKSGEKIRHFNKQQHLNCKIKLITH